MTTPAKPDAEVKVDEELTKKMKELPLKDRLKAIALNSLMKQKQTLDKELRKEMRKLQFKYETQSAVFNNKSNEIIEGSRLPEGEELVDLDKFFSPEEIAQKDTVLTAGVPIESFWLKALKNCPMVREQVVAKDEPALKSLKRIVVKTKEDTFDFALEFTFGPNDYFTNEVLTKTINFDADGEQPQKTTGTPITWKEGKNLTKKTVKKKQKNKKTGAQRVITKEVDDESFFNFFKDSAPAPEDAEEDDEEEPEDDAGMRFEIDLDVADVLQDDVLPHALDYFVGLVHDEEGGDEDFDDEDDEDEDEDDDEDDKPKGKPRKKSSRAEEDDEDEDDKPKGGKKKGKGGKGAEGAAGAKPECKQQ